jgi:hypothetical protein
MQGNTVIERRHSHVTRTTPCTPRNVPPKARLSLLLPRSYRTLRFEKLPPFVQRVNNHREKGREGVLNHLLAHHA